MCSVLLLNNAASNLSAATVFSSVVLSISQYILLLIGKEERDQKSILLPLSVSLKRRDWEARKRIKIELRLFEKGQSIIRDL